VTVLYPATQPSIFGPIVSGHDVEQWSLALIRKWFSTYLAEKEAQDGLTRGALQRPRGYVIAPSLDKWPEDQLPAIVLVSVGLAERPLKEGSGRYRARWDMGVACICSARTQSESHANAQRYMAALRLIFIQRPSLDGKASGVDWQGEQYDQLDYDDLRSIDGGFGQFTVEVEDIALAGGGPATPDVPLAPDDTLPWPDWTAVETADVVVQRVDVIQPTKGGTS
jgi:hypothetical protein